VTIALRDWASRLGKEPDTAEFEVTEAFAVTRSNRQRQSRNEHERGAPSATGATTLAAARDTKNGGPSSIISARGPPAAAAVPPPQSHGIETHQLARVLEKEPEKQTTRDTDTLEEAKMEQPEAAVELRIEVSEHHKTLIRQAIRRSERFAAIYDRLKTAPKVMVDGVERYELPDTCQYVLHDDLLYLVDPATGQHRLTIVGTTLQKQHLTAAHSPAHYGRARMADDLRVYYWPRMAQDIQRFLKHCPECLRNKPANHKPFGLLSPIPTPSEPFDTWSIDLVTDLPACAIKNTIIQYDTVMTVTDKFSKAVRFLPGRKDWSAADWATSVYEGVTLNGWGYPKAIISDRDKRFL
jgi:hypothetical protein